MIEPPERYRRCHATAARTGQRCRRGAEPWSVVCPQHDDPWWFIAGVSCGVAAGFILLFWLFAALLTLLS